MNDVLGELIALLGLERIEENLFRGQSQDLGWGRVFGGQVLGQALSAATQTVPKERTVHSLHSYFLRSGDSSRPIVYEVDRIRDGRSFTTRRVVAIQGGRAIFHLSASFQVQEEGFEHQKDAPETPGPEGLLSDRDLLFKFKDQLSDKLLTRALSEHPIELRPVNPVNPVSPKIGPAKRAVWCRANRPLPDDQALHRYLLAYASDFHFLVTTMLPHGVSWLTPGMQVASLDHAMWFHRPFRMDEWLLHVMESPAASGGRGLVRGNIYKEDGTLVVSTVQEGLIRQRATNTP